MSMRVLALDAAAIRTGWSMFEFDNPVLLPVYLMDFGSVELPEKMKIGERLLLLEKAIRSLMERYRPDRVAIEQSYIRFIKAAETLLKVSGLLQKLAYQMTGQEAVMVDVATVRAQLHAKDKKAVAEVLRRHFPSVDKNTKEDETDAIAVGMVSQIVIRRKECKKPQRRRLKERSSPSS